MTAKPLSGNPIGNASKPSGGPKWFLGVDLGGTSIKFALFAGLHFVAEDRRTTADFESPRLAFQEIADWCVGHFATIGRSTQTSPGGDPLASLRGIGLAMPGVLVGGGTLAETANLHQWHRVDFGRELAAVFGQTPAVINDANAAALGECHTPAEADESERFASANANLIFLTLGTGVGGGVIVDGRAVTGAAQCGGEIGHSVVDHSSDARVCGCGFPGHLEAYVGSAGILQTMRELAEDPRYRDDRPTTLLDDHKGSVSPADLAVAACRSDPLAQAVVRKTGEHLGRAIAASATVTNPAQYVLGGAINFGGHGTVGGELFLESIRDEVRRVSLREIGERLSLRFARLGGRSGLYGAAFYAMQTARDLNRSNRGRGAAAAGH